MTIQKQIHLRTLYDNDYNQWVENTVKLLQSQDFTAVDWENLIDEISDLSRREKSKLKKLLTILLEHLLKLAYWQSELLYNQNHWRAEILSFRKQIRDCLKNSPSLKPYLIEILGECYQDAKEITSDRISMPLEIFPDNLMINPEQVLDENWFLPEYMG